LGFELHSLCKNLSFFGQLLFLWLKKRLYFFLSKSFGYFFLIFFDFVIFFSSLFIKNKILRSIHY